MLLEDHETSVWSWSIADKVDVSLVERSTDLLVEIR